MKNKLLKIIILLTIVGWVCLYYSQYKRNQIQREEVQKLKLIERIVFTDNYRKKNGLPLINKNFVKEDSLYIYTKGIDSFIEVHYNKKNGDEKNIYKVSNSIFFTIKYANMHNSRILGVVFSNSKDYRNISFVDFFKLLKKHNKLSLSNNTLFYNEQIKERKLNDTIVSYFEKEELKKLNTPYFNR